MRNVNYLSVIQINDGTRKDMHKHTTIMLDNKFYNTMLLPFYLKNS